MTDAGPEGMTVIYDGECPFCSNYVRLMALRKATGKVELVDARSDDPRVRDVQKQGFDLNEGMAALYGGKTYYGSDAIVLISVLAGGGSIFKRALSGLLRNPKRARFLYPYMKFGRNITLRALGRKPISSSLGAT